jgi:hypothetical protein
MGIQRLFQFLRRYEQSVTVSSFIHGKRIAIDIFTYIHRSKGRKADLLAEIGAILHEASHTYIVFDGSPSEERTELLSGHADYRQTLVKQIEIIQSAIPEVAPTLSFSDRAHLHTYVRTLQQQAWTPSPRYIWEIHDELRAMGAECILGEKGVEADQILTDLATSGKADVIITNDSDVLANGAPAILRPNGLYYDRAQILDGLGFTDEEWSMFIELCRSLAHMSEPDAIFTAIKVYGGDVEHIKKIYNTVDMQINQTTA